MKRSASFLVFALIMFLTFGCLATSSFVVKSDSFGLDPSEVMESWKTGRVQLVGPLDTPDETRTIMVCLGIFFNPKQGAEIKQVAMFFCCDTKEVFSVGWMEGETEWAFVKYGTQWKQVKPNP